MSRLGLIRPALYGLSWLWSSNGGDNSSLKVQEQEKLIFEQNKESSTKSSESSNRISFDKYSICHTKVKRKMIERGIPGMVVGVSIKGTKTWSEAFGYCDVEHLTTCRTNSVMRIASISKSVTMATVVAKLLEQNILDLDKSIHDYLDQNEFPPQKLNGTVYDIKLRHLLTNTSGIRHYNSDEFVEKLTPIGSPKSLLAYRTKSEIMRNGVYEKRNFHNVMQSLDLFKNDDLVCEPGTRFQYTTNGWVLVSAIVQKVLKKNENFEDHLIRVLRQELGLRYTFLDQEEPLISDRSKYYRRNGYNGQLLNAPTVDNSCKWAGGGLLSNTDDLLKLANILLNSYKGREGAFLKSETVKSMWTPIVSMRNGEHYGLGFMVGSKKANHVDPYIPFNYYVYHTGAAVGASSILMILPEEEIVVVLIANLQGISLWDLAVDIIKVIGNKE